MTDNRLDEAVDIVARHVIAATIDFGSEAEREDHPDIGEDDWLDVFRHVRELAPYPDQAQFEAAYQYLTGRAGEPT